MNHKFRVFYKEGTLPFQHLTLEDLVVVSDEKFFDYEYELFSGVQSSEGTDIYEGDIVYLAGYGEYTVKFPFLELYDALHESDVGAIIGNIHQDKKD